MVQTEPDGPYVYQPHGSAGNSERVREGLLWAVGGVRRSAVAHLTKIDGLTRVEAEAVRDALIEATL